MEETAVPVELAARPAALILLFALNLADVFTTRRALALGGQETNPLAAHLLAQSMDVLLLAKVALIAAIVAACIFTSPRHALRSARWVWMAVIFYGGVVIWNCLQILSSRLA
jgi:Domain of unknown function (DUF5658)